MSLKKFIQTHLTHFFAAPAKGLAPIETPKPKTQEQPGILQTSDIAVLEESVRQMNSMIDSFKIIEDACAKKQCISGELKSLEDLMTHSDKLFDIFDSLRKKHGEVVIAAEVSAEDAVILINEITSVFAETLIQCGNYVGVIQRLQESGPIARADEMLTRLNISMTRGVPQASQLHLMLARCCAPPTPQAPLSQQPTVF